MAILSAADRNRMKGSTFGLPGERKYPMPDPGHAINAKARAKQQLDKGNLSPGQYSQIISKANKVEGGAAHRAKVVRALAGK